MMRWLAAALSLVILAGCGAIKSNSRAVFVLVDASGSYARTMEESITTSRLIVAKLNPNDSIAVAQISSCSFSDDSVVFNQRLPGIPSQASHMKQAIFGALNAYGEGFKSSDFTDIHGALRYAANELEANRATSRYVVVFSDMIEDLAPDCDTSELSLDLAGITVIATNVTKTKADSSNPDLYDERLATWEKIVTDAGGQWRHAKSRDQLLDEVF
ncbi:vWA domain-containing protein [Hyphomonas johnsonii]|uniref:Response regulator receiver domain-containing protein (CheY-like) n=1 Tax=Hyphomonas johnsonii MHS-2 TaxID=1280950 RepID=A0A059FMV9_9PROT|nr:vWA domain-containing protein [Hyphomonas johnsonii]KCZ91813.1 response regulator receiver domain-containing protein (CheY-like) [Hyphomonas johnsonii MHS-2]